MRLAVLLNSIYPVMPSFDCEISGVTNNSRQVEPGNLFLACRGRTVDGCLFIDEALAKGAVAVLVEADQPGLGWRQNIPLISLPQLHTQVAEIAGRFFGFPTQKVKTIGVTGTNGKTSSSHFVAQALQALQHPCGIIGTLGSGFPEDLRESTMTTPDAVSLQKRFAELLAQGAQYLAMEVSSHSLDQERIKGLQFAVGIFTNLTQDHLDYHGNMQAYGAAKKRLFTDYPVQHAVINADDVFGQTLISLLDANKIIAYSTKAQCATVPTVYTEQVNFDLSGMRAQVFTPWGAGELFAPLIGAFNLSNVLAVLATLGSLGFPLQDILSVLAQLKPVPGRMQLLGGNQQPHVVVDYSHTPDALEKALKALRQHCQGKLLCLFGCGGNRDQGKRPLMGAIAEQYADVVMLTNDNPRHEDPEDILKQILSGLKDPQQVRVQPNRSKAIQDIIQYAGSQDYVLIAGKGAENYQQIGDEKLPFSDAQHVSEILM